MSDRSALEKASWIAGIVGALLAVFLFVRSELLTAGASSKQSNLSAAPTASTSPTSEQSASQSQPSSQVPKWSCAQPMREFRDAIEAAAGIWSSPTRDKAYLEVARKALCVHDYVTFEAVASKIWSSVTRDQAYVDAVDFGLRNGNPAVANKYVVFIWSSPTRDAARVRVSTRSSGG